MREEEDPFRMIEPLKPGLPAISSRSISQGVPSVQLLWRPAPNNWPVVNLNNEFERDLHNFAPSHPQRSSPTGASSSAHLIPSVEPRRLSTRPSRRRTLHVPRASSGLSYCSTSSPSSSPSPNSSSILLAAFRQFQHPQHCPRDKRLTSSTCVNQHNSHQHPCQKHFHLRQVAVKRLRELDLNVNTEDRSLLQRQTKNQHRKLAPNRSCA